MNHKCDKAGCKESDAEFRQFGIGGRAVCLAEPRTAAWDNDEHAWELSHKSSLHRIAVDAHVHAGNASLATDAADRLFAQERVNRDYIAQWLSCFWL